ncbi:MAG: ATP-binding cassette domain-containing protein, partial [Alphaproteobacteria bacterium]|nr:ATP-binding cassette domain-containing protein [Alphaproteobacteria bacterium]
MTQSSSAAADDPVVVVSSLSIAQRSGRVLLRNVNLRLGAGEVVILAGPSGSGKSTLVNLLSGAIEMREGGWDVSGQVGFAGETYDLARERVTVGGVVFQNFALFDELTVAENLAIAADHNPAVSDSLKTAIDGLLRDVDRSLPVNSVSGGQKQRIAIARTLLGNHPVLFLDEPNSGLDVSASRRLSLLVKELAQEIGVPVIIVAHHFRHLIDVADRVLMLDPSANDLVELPVDAARIERELEAIETGHPRAPGERPMEAAPAMIATRLSDRAGRTTVQSPARAWRPVWGLKFLLGYLWELCFAPSALLFVGLGSVITGFVTTWFIFMYLPFRDYLMPIIHSDALAGLAFSELRVLAPLLTAVLISTRNSALIGADIGHKVYSDQIKSMRNLNVPHQIYINATVLLSSAVAAVV